MSLPNDTTDRPRPEPPGSPAAEVTAAPARRAKPSYGVESLAVGAVFVAAFAFLASLFAVGLAARAIDEHQAVAGSTPVPAAGGSATAVSLTEFAINPGALTVAAGARLNVSNDGSIVHNLSVDGVATPMLDSGEAAELDISDLGPGTYSIRCDVPGHEAAGMAGTMTIE